MPDKKRMPPNKKVKILIRVEEKELQQKIKTMGGVWDHKNKVWILSFKKARELNLTKRIAENFNVNK